MKKIFIMMSLGILLTCMAGCEDKGSSKNVDKKDVYKSHEVEGSLIADGLKISVSNPKIYKMNTGDAKKNVYTFEISGENVSSSDKGLGSINFVLKMQDGKEVNIDPDLDSFGDEVKKNKSISGPVSFAIEEKNKPQKIIYKVSDKNLAEWDIKQ
ncbi:TPA: hypothetical protein ACHU8X_002550 [Enterococcus faecalis]